MSDAVKSVDIEEVLSSIKKLVTVDRSRLTEAEDPHAADDDKLILTSDLRVVKDGETASMVSPLVLSDSVANDDHATSESEREEPLAAGLAFVTEADASDATEIAPAAETLEDRIAGLEAAVAAQASEFEPDGSEEPSQHIPVSVMPRRVHLAMPEVSEDEAGDEEAEAADQDIQDQAEPSVIDFHRSETLTDTDEAEATDNAPEIDASAISEIVESEILDAESARFGSYDAVEDDPLEQTDFLEDPDSVLDEAALREIVADIVRQELQGALGERITRNVRKLVRREIMRANSVRDFE